jgi:hypothetical protein
MVLTAALITVNRDLFKFTYDLRLERTFTPGTDTHRDYLLTDPVPLKPGAYMLFPSLTVNGSGSSVILTGGEASDAVKRRADYISRICKEKHPYDSGIAAREGIEW